MGTGIVEALVKNLEGEITLTDADPGTVVTVTRRQTPGLLTEVSPAA